MDEQATSDAWNQYKFRPCWYSWYWSQARHGINCLELPLIQHRQGPDLNRLHSVLSGTFFTNLAGLLEMILSISNACPHNVAGCVSDAF